MQVCVKGVISQEKLYGCICGAVMSKEALSVEYFGYRRLGLSRTMRGVLEFSSLLDDLNSSGQQFGSWGEASETMDIAEAQGLKQLSWTSRNYPSLKTLTLSIVSRLVKIAIAALCLKNLIADLGRNPLPRQESQNYAKLLRWQ